MPYWINAALSGTLISTGIRSISCVLEFFTGVYQVLSATFLQQGPNVKKNSKFFVICYLGNFIVKKLQNKSAKAKCKSEKGRIFSLFTVLTLQRHPLWAGLDPWLGWILGFVFRCLASGLGGSKLHHCVLELKKHLGLEVKHLQAI